jgi:hypothetical protein
VLTYAHFIFLPAGIYGGARDLLTRRRREAPARVAI